MRILYGVQGTGNGHITRARMMAEGFAAQGVDVDYFFSGRAEDKYFDMEAFGEFRTRAGLSFVTEQGSIKVWKTAKQLGVSQFFKDLNKLDVSKYDLVFNDFEPLSAWAARRQGVPVVAMSHQASFLHDAVPSPGNQFFHRALIRNFAPADVYLGVHWRPYHSHILPPFVTHTPANTYCPSIANKVLVYLPFEQLSSVVDFLNDFPDKEFYCYHPEATDQSLKHIHLRAPSRGGFLRDLTNSSGVVANAGFELSTEALQLGKKLLLKPLHGQFEQQANIVALEQLNLAQSMNYLNPNALDDWMKSTGEGYCQFPSDPSPLIDWLLKKQWQDVDTIHHRLWQQVAFSKRHAA
ncbi:MJ1255/VC2487 family glycosyltransferase [Pseudoalteromonas xiamenensis]|uniref:Glycosyltransferase n=1 Tax=Pseudoalteromonas xiamenensis TaxID=882626 RepID=A0A975DEX9_9GAMM|nr:MJ1255/VC2487 family glycosyltransferase [Pseudoalteromonas xiamenensis]QTH70533.1 glycosyltransferase [Pseudoalteromonas xiamenensis]